MLKALMPIVAALLLILGPSYASAQIAGPTFRVVSQASGNCLTLSAPDQNDGGTLTTAPCQNFANFFVTVVGGTGEAVLQFRLNSLRFVCIYSTEAPVIGPSDHRAKVSARNCAAPPPPGIAVNSLWNVRGVDSNGFQQIEKMKGPDSSGFCMLEATPNPQGTDIELEVCQGINAENWKLQPVP